MLAANLFRPIPRPPSVTAIETPDSVSDTAWPHLSLVYDAFQASFSLQQQPVALTGTFIYQLIGNGASPDDRERLVVRDILHAMYAKFMSLRTVIREKVACQFTTGVCSSEIIEFLVSVVSGFNSPLNPEHVTYFHRYVKPLHGFYNYHQFSKPLTQLIVRYISKSGFLLAPAIQCLLKHWPRAHRQKQALFLAELESFFCNFEIHVTSQMAVSAFRLIGEVTINDSTEVAYAAIGILMNPALGFLLKAHAARCYPVIVGPTYRAARKHWDDCIRSNAFVALQNLSELDPATFGKSKDALKPAKAKTTADASQVQANWARVFEAAKAADPGIRCVSADS
jgi:hypothetical protein